MLQINVEREMKKEWPKKGSLILPIRWCKDC